MAGRAAEAIRAFLALDLDSASRRRVARVADQLRMGNGVPSATWVSATQMHVTLKFIAELPIEAVALLANAVRPLVEGREAPDASRFRLGAFPTLEAARVVVVELGDEARTLTTLAAGVDKLAHQLDIPREKRPFHPHVTLARLKRPYDSRRWLRPHLAAASGECRASGITLYRSEMGSAGSTYIPMARFSFV